jgi:hypothetical protein
MERYDELYRTAYGKLPLALAPAHDALAAFRDRVQKEAPGSDPAQFRE